MSCVPMDWQVPYWSQCFDEERVYTAGNISNVDLLRLTEQQVLEELFREEGQAKHHGVSRELP